MSLLKNIYIHRVMLVLATVRLSKYSLNSQRVVYQFHQKCGCFISVNFGAVTKEHTNLNGLRQQHLFLLHIAFWWL